MQSSSRSRLPFRQGAISEWNRSSLLTDRLCVTLNDIDNFASKYTILPNKCDIFNMFRMLRPEDVRVVLVGQSPYPGHCPATGMPYACGPAFLPAPGCTTTPVTLRNMVAEVCRDFGKTRPSKPPRDMLIDWINQGVMLLNSSLTIGANCPKYLEDHSIAWQEVVQNLIEGMSSTNPDTVFVLIGKDAWKFESCIGSDKLIKVSHPVARGDTATPWMGSRVFSRVSNMMIDMDMAPIRWL